MSTIFLIVFASSFGWLLLLSTSFLRIYIFVYPIFGWYLILSTLFLVIFNFVYHFSGGFILNFGCDFLFSPDAEVFSSILFSVIFYFRLPYFWPFSNFVYHFYVVFTSILGVIFYSVQTQKYFVYHIFGWFLFCLLYLGWFYIFVYHFLVVSSSILGVIFYSVQTQKYFRLSYFWLFPFLSTIFLAISIFVYPIFGWYLILSTLFLVIFNFVYHFSGGFILHFGCDFLFSPDAEIFSSTLFLGNFTFLSTLF